MEFELLIKRLSSKLKAMIKKMNGGYPFFDEEDLYQEALLYLWEGYRNKRLYYKTDSFILQSCFFFLKNYIRKTYKKIDTHTIRLNELKDKEKSTAEISLKDELLIRDIEGHLPERERKVFLYILSGLTMREIAKCLGISHVMVLKIKNTIKEKCKRFRREII